MPTTSTLAIVHLAMGPFIGALAVSLGLWVVLLVVGPPLAVGLALYVGLTPCVAVLLAAMAGRDLRPAARLPMVVAVGALTSLAETVYWFDMEDYALFLLLMTAGGGASAAICDTLSRRVLRHGRIAATAWSGMAAWSVLWCLLAAIRHQS